MVGEGEKGAEKEGQHTVRKEIIGNYIVDHCSYQAVCLLNKFNTTLIFNNKIN